MADVIIILRLTDEKRFSYTAPSLDLGKGKVYRKFFHPPRAASWAGRIGADVVYVHDNGLNCHTRVPAQGLYILIMPRLFLSVSQLLSLFRIS